MRQSKNRRNIYCDSVITHLLPLTHQRLEKNKLRSYLTDHFAEFGIRTNVLSHGVVYNNQSEEFVVNYSRLTPLNRMVSASEYQGAILFLMSEASSYMTGANLIVDGGWTAW